MIHHVHKTRGPLKSLEKKGVTKALSECRKERPGSKIIFQMENCEEARDFKHCYTQCSAILLPIVSQRFSGISITNLISLETLLIDMVYLAESTLPERSFKYQSLNLLVAETASEINTNYFQDRNKIL